jgi:hypothetical protein
MRFHAIFLAGAAGGLLLGAYAGTASAQVRVYPDASACNHLDGGALLTCQNQVYTQQMESGVSNMAGEPAEVQSSHIEGNEAGQSDFVPGAEGTELPSAAASSPVYSTLPGPEGTVRIYGPTE